LHYDLRTIVCEGMSDVLNFICEVIEELPAKQEHLHTLKLRLLHELCELMDDEEPIVKIQAVSQLAGILQKYKSNEILESGVLKHMRG